LKTFKNEKDIEPLILEIRKKNDDCFHIASQPQKTRTDSLRDRKEDAKQVFYSTFLPENYP